MRFKLKGFYIDTNKSYSVKALWSVSLWDVGSMLTLRSNPGLDSDTVGRLFKMLLSYAVMVLLGLVAEMKVPVGQCYASHEIVLAVS